LSTEEFNYDLPEELIAQTPLINRSSSKLLVMDRFTGEIEHKHFEDILSYLKEGDVLVLNNTKVIPARLIGLKEETNAKIELLLLNEIEHKIFKDIIDYLQPGDCLVRNNTKVIPARLYGKKETGANVEFLLLNNIEGDIWESIVRPGNKLHIGTKVIFGDGLLEAEILDIMPGGTRKVKFHYKGIFNEILDQIGLMPLPPYIHETLKEKDRYQTVYAKFDGSAAAPTAGLHFTKELLEKIKQKGVEVANVTLHVGIGTFRPVKVETVEEHQMHSEHYYIKQEDADKINKAKKGKLTEDEVYNWLVENK